MFKAGWLSLRQALLLQLMVVFRGHRLPIPVSGPCVVLLTFPSTKQGWG